MTKGPGIPIFWNHDQHRPAGTTQLDQDSIDLIETLTRKGVDVVLSPAFRHNGVDDYTLIAFGITNEPAQQVTNHIGMGQEENIMTQPHQPSPPTIGDLVRLPAAYGIFASIDATLASHDPASGWATVDLGKYGIIGAPLADLRPAPDPDVATTHVLMVIDKSGSMAPLANDVIGGYNSYLDGLTGDDGTYRVTITLFDTETVTVCTDAALADAPRLCPGVQPGKRAYEARADEGGRRHATYSPGGGTALLDAIAHTILTFEANLGANKRVLLVISTDGEENSSGPENTWDTVNNMIDTRVSDGKWTSIYLGAGPQAWHQARRFSASTHTVGTHATTKGTADSYAGLTAASSMYAAGASGEQAARAIRQHTKGPDLDTPA